MDRTCSAGGGGLVRVLILYIYKISYFLHILNDSYSHGKISNMYVERPKLKLSNKKARFVIQDVDTIYI